MNIDVDVDVDDVYYAMSNYEKKQMAKFLIEDGYCKDNSETCDCKVDPESVSLSLSELDFYLLVKKLTKINSMNVSNEDMDKFKRFVDKYFLG